MMYHCLGRARARSLSIRRNLVFSTLAAATLATAIAFTV